MSACIYPGSFDPITKGHLDIIERAAALFDTVYVGVLQNIAKNNLFPADFRVQMIEASTEHLEGVKVLSFDGMLVELLKQLEVRIIVRGLRSGHDLEMEQQLSYVNKHLLPGTETIALFAQPENSIVSSTLVRELISFHSDISEYVPKKVVAMINGGKEA
jgi:pantetheine-phosphate adenylyltransferase